MKRQVSIEEISDGRLYDKNDMVRAGCGGCKGCSACCRGMGGSVILDPLDVFRLTAGLGVSCEALLADRMELGVVDGVILPNLRMQGSGEQCAFLNGEGRCSVHALRPGICRLFPLGRYYPDDGSRGFRYFLQVHECPLPNKTKVRVSKWVDTPDLQQYEKFVNDWHYFLEDVQERLERETEENVKNINLLLLRLFYLRPYDGTEAFYPQFALRLEQAKEILGFA